MYSHCMLVMVIFMTFLPVFQAVRGLFCSLDPGFPVHEYKLNINVEYQVFFYVLEML